MTIYKKWYQKKLNTLHVDSVKAGGGPPLTVNSLELETMFQLLSTHLWWPILWRVLAKYYSMRIKFVTNRTFWQHKNHWANREIKHDVYRKRQDENLFLPKQGVTSFI